MCWCSSRWHHCSWRYTKNRPAYLYLQEVVPSMVRLCQSIAYYCCTRHSARLVGLGTRKENSPTSNDLAICLTASLKNMIESLPCKGMIWMCSVTIVDYGQREPFCAATQCWWLVHISRPTLMPPPATTDFSSSERWSGTNTRSVSRFGRQLQWRDSCILKIGGKTIFPSFWVAHWRQFKESIYRKGHRVQVCRKSNARIITTRFKN